MYYTIHAFHDFQTLEKFQHAAVQKNWKASRGFWIKDTENLEHVYATLGNLKEEE